MDRELIELYVYQYLVERGYAMAAMAMKEESKQSLTHHIDASSDNVSALCARGDSAAMAPGQLLKAFDDLTHLRSRMAELDSNTTRAKQKRIAFNAADVCGTTRPRETEGQQATSSASTNTAVRDGESTAEPSESSDPIHRNQQLDTMTAVDTADAPFPAVEYAAIEGRHAKNIICCRMTHNATGMNAGCADDSERGNEQGSHSNSGSGLLVSGGADRQLCFSRIAGLPEGPHEDAASVELSSPFKAPILAIDAHPTLPVTIVGLMDGTSYVVDNHGEVLQEGPKHKKYVVRCAWSGCGNFFATASYDKTAQLWGRVGGSAYPTEDGAWQPFAHLQTFTYEGSVECVAFAPRIHAATPESTSTKGGEGADKSTPTTTSGSGKDLAWELIVGVRNDCCLHIYTPVAAEGGSGKDVATISFSEAFLNTNELQDDFVSFSVRDVSVSPNGKYIVAATDKDRVILLSRAAKCLVQVYYGAVNDEYSNPRVAFNSNGRYIFCTSQNNTVIVWCTATQQLLATLEGHKGVIRDMHYSAADNLLFTASFDKTIRVWGPHDA